ncbi:MAG: hypothetical protein IE932_14185 [Sphingopyxis terrae]|nr:hypothetical protein [Sphingopyxis terrae]
MTDIRASMAPAPFIPHWLRDQPNPPAFHLRAGSTIERELLEAELAGEYRAGRVWPFELAQILSDAFRAMGGDDTPTLIDLVQRELAFTTGAGEKLTDAEQATLDAARQVAIEHWPDYAALVAQMQRRETLLPILAFRRFCAGWDNAGTAFLRGVGGFVADSAMKKLKPLYIRAAGIEAYNLQYLDEEAEKNSEAPLPSSDSPPTSGSGATSTADGKSAPTAGTKTPPSSSPETSASSSDCS